MPMAPKIAFRDRSSGQRGSNSGVLEGPRLPSAREGRRKTLERFFESKFWFCFSKPKLKHSQRLRLRIKHRHFAWGLSEKHIDFHFITIPLDSIRFWGTSSFSDLGEFSVCDTGGNRGINCVSPCAIDAIELPLWVFIAWDSKRIRIDPWIASSEFFKHTGQTGNRHFKRR